MINQSLDILRLIQFELIGLFVVFFAISFFWKNIYSSLSLKSYQSKQRLHQDEIPRIGGLIIYVFLSITAFFAIDSSLLNIILVSAIPIVFISVKEDLFHNTRPNNRLIFMVASTSLFIYLLPTNLPEIDLPLLNLFLSFSVIKELFFIFSMLVIINGNNLIDGVNGNMALTNIVQLCVLFMLAINVNDYFIAELCIILIIPLIIFLIFNFPFGKIFGGDGGAYFYGFSISAAIIYFFGMHNQLLSWNAVLILIYPSTELLFSFIRKKFFDNKSPLQADGKHLHTIIYRILVHGKKSFSNNSIVVLYLSPLILYPFLIIYNFFQIYNLFFLLFIFILFYIFIYLYIINKFKKYYKYDIK
jgi:UDP-GlcNAc:undecaprenyl-phosphate GlcNAc-1-phosphate transferase